MWFYRVSVRCIESKRSTQCHRLWKCSNLIDSDCTCFECKHQNWNGQSSGMTCWADSVKRKVRNRNAHAVAHSLREAHISMHISSFQWSHLSHLNNWFVNGSAYYICSWKMLCHQRRAPLRDPTMKCKSFFFFGISLNMCADGREKSFDFYLIATKPLWSNLIRAIKITAWSNNTYTTSCQNELIN